LDTGAVTDGSGIEDEPYSVLALIRSRIDSLPPGEARVARAILDQPYAALTWSAQEMAQRAQTSSATTVRASHRLGFEGLPHLRIALARELGWTRLWSDAASQEPEGSLKAVFSTAADALTLVGEHMDMASFRAAASAIAGARRVVFVCAGPTQVVCQDAMFDLISIGRPAEYFGDSTIQTVIASKLDPEDVCVAVGVSGSNPLTIGAADAAKQAGAAVIAITCFGQSELAGLADIRLIVSGPETPFSLHGAVSLVAMILTLRTMTIAVAELTGKQDRSPLQNYLRTGGVSTDVDRRRPRRPHR
jgi:DNA-binding MurR/RpiR family transcriptional regulator